MQLFSRTITNKNGKVLIRKIPENWGTKKLIDSLNALINSANEAHSLGYTGVELNGVTIQFEDLKEMYISYKFLGITYKYGDLK